MPQTILQAWQALRPPPPPYGQCPNEPGDNFRGASLTRQKLTHSLFKNTTIEHTERFATLEACDQKYFFLFSDTVILWPRIGAFWALSKLSQYVAIDMPKTLQTKCKTCFGGPRLIFYKNEPVGRIRYTPLQSGTRMNFQERLIIIVDKTYLQSGRTTSEWNDLGSSLHIPRENWDIFSLRNRNLEFQWVQIRWICHHWPAKTVFWLCSEFAPASEPLQTPIHNAANNPHVQTYLEDVQEMQFLLDPSGTYLTVVFIIIISTSPKIKSRILWKIS